MSRTLQKNEKRKKKEEFAEGIGPTITSVNISELLFHCTWFFLWDEPTEMAQVAGIRV